MPEVEVASANLMILLNSILKLLIWDILFSALKKKTINLEAQWEKWLTITQNNSNLETKTYAEWKTNQPEDQTTHKNSINFNKKTEA